MASSLPRWKVHRKNVTIINKNYNKLIRDRHLRPALVFVEHLDLFFQMFWV